MKQATKLNQVMLLIKSLSKAEKRYIRLYTNLQNGYTIKVGITTQETIGIDTPDDLQKALTLL